MSNLPYSDKEICKSFMQNPCEEQIQILSELNDCKRQTIIHTLSCYGIKVEDGRLKAKKVVYQNKNYIKRHVVIRFNANNSLVLGYLKKRKQKLEFMSLCFPERQREWLDEMQELRNLIDLENSEKGVMKDGKN